MIPMSAIPTKGSKLRTIPTRGTLHKAIPMIPMSAIPTKVGSNLLEDSRDIPMIPMRAIPNRAIPLIQMPGTHRAAINHMPVRPIKVIQLIPMRATRSNPIPEDNRDIRMLPIPDIHKAETKGIRGIPMYDTEGSTLVNNSQRSPWMSRS